MTNPQKVRSDHKRGADYKEISASYQEELSRVEEAITSNFNSDVALIPNVSSYLIGGGGKRIRPLLVIVTSKLCGYTEGSSVIDYSVVVEYIHAASLLHDDVVDEADLRRGAMSANMKYGNQASVLVGDFLFAKSFQLMSDGSDMRIVESVSRATKSLAEGEVMQLVNTRNIDTSEETYMNTIFRKTGALIMSCCEIGAILGGVSEEKGAALTEYGRNIGIAFQLMDDILDYTAEAKQWGKPIGADLAEGKPTLPLIRAYKLAEEPEREFIRKALEDDPAGACFEPVLSILKRYDALAYTSDMARSHAEEAKLKLSCFEPSQNLSALHAIANYIVDRKD